MPTLRTLEYLCYLGIFILLFRLSEAATIDLSQTMSNTVSKSVDSAKDYAEPGSATSAGRSATASDAGLKQTLEECNTSFSWMCMKLEFIRILESLAEREELRLLNGVSVVKDPEAKEVKTSELMAGKCNFNNFV